MIDALKLAEALRLMADGLELASAALEEDGAGETRKVDDKADKTAADKAAKEKAAKEKAAKEAEAEKKAAAEAKKAEEEAAASAKGDDEGGEVKLSDLQDQAAILLAGGHRRTLKTILDEVGVKSLSTADPSTYADLKEKLGEAVEGMELT